jgi:hypothetical protein
MFVPAATVGTVISGYPFTVVALLSIEASSVDEGDVAVACVRTYPASGPDPVNVEPTSMRILYD